MIRNIAFDFGGVIVDLDREEAVQAFIRLGLENAGRIMPAASSTNIIRQESSRNWKKESSVKNPSGKSWAYCAASRWNAKKCGKRGWAS